MTTTPKEHQYKLCLYNRPDYFALRDGGICDCLNDTDFRGRDCPFYKPLLEATEGTDD